MSYKWTNRISDEDYAWAVNYLEKRMQLRSQQIYSTASLTGQTNGERLKFLLTDLEKVEPDLVKKVGIAWSKRKERKQKKTTTISFELTPSAKKELYSLAKTHQKSHSDTIKRLIYRGFKYENISGKKYQRKIKELITDNRQYEKHLREQRNNEERNRKRIMQELRSEKLINKQLTQELSYALALLEKEEIKKADLDKESKKKATTIFNRRTKSIQADRKKAKKSHSKVTSKNKEDLASSQPITATNVVHLLSDDFGPIDPDL